MDTNAYERIEKLFAYLASELWIQGEYARAVQLLHTWSEISAKAVNADRAADAIATEPPASAAEG